MGKTKVGQFLSIAFLLLFYVAGQSAERDRAKESAIELQLEKISPESVEIFRQATIALDRNDHAKAAQLYSQVLSNAPDFDHALRRLGGCLIQLGQHEKGISLLYSAVVQDRSFINLMSLAEQIAYRTDKEATHEDLQKALSLAKEAFQKQNDREALFFYANMALRLDSQNDLNEAVSLCTARYPNEMLTHYFSAIKAAYNEDWTKSENEIIRARELGLDPQVADKILASGIHRNALIWRYTWLTVWLLVAWALGLGLIYVFGKFMSRKVMIALKNTDPNQIREKVGDSFKRIYRSLINFAGFYYYISLPVLMVLLIAVAGSIFYAFMLMGRIPIKLVAVLGIITLGTIYQMVRTLFIKHKPQDPGRELKTEEAPGLQQLLMEVAERVGTRPIDQIRITSGTDLAVYEKGSYRARMQDKAQRLLILGVGVLDNFRLNAFRAVIAHEYGHFSHRDTAGGDIAFRVNADMSNFAIAILTGGLAAWYNIGFQFLRLYSLLFNRISHGASRLQEIMADIAAVTHYGASAFEEGLRHAILRNVRFEAAAAQIDENAALQTLSGLRSLYEPVVQNPEDPNSISEKMGKVLKQPTSEDDTHPSPADRFTLARRVQSEPQPGANGYVWDLFIDREGLTQEMVRLVGASLGIQETVEGDVEAAETAQQLCMEKP